MEANRLKLLEKRFDVDATIYKENVVKLDKECALLSKKINIIKNEFNKIKDRIKSIRNEKRDNYKLDRNITTNYLNDLQVIGEEYKKLKIELTFKQNDYTTAIQTLRNINQKKENSINKIIDSELIDEVQDDEFTIEDFSSISQSQNYNYCSNIEDISYGVNAERQKFNSDSINLNQNNTPQNLSTEFTLCSNNLPHDLSDKIKDVQTFQNDFGKSLSFSYSPAENHEIKINFYNGYNNYMVNIIPNLLKDKLKIWHNINQISQAFNNAGIKLNSLKVLGRIKNA